MHYGKRTQNPHYLKWTRAAGWEWESTEEWKEDGKRGTADCKQHCVKVVQAFKVGLGQTLVLLTMLYNRQNSLLIFLSPCFRSWSHLLLISSLALPLLAFIPPSPCRQPHPPPTVQILFLPLLSSSPPFFSLLLFILSLPVSRDSICAECVVCVRICEHIETEIHLRAHWFKNTFDIGGPLLQICSEAYHTRT